MPSGQPENMSKANELYDCAQRPKSLAAVSLLVSHQRNTSAEPPEQNFYGYLREFLDSFYVEQDKLRRIAMLTEEPPPLSDATENAYLAGVAEHLALRYGLGVPPWVHGPSRFLKRAFFPSGLESLKAMLIAQSPAAFRRRLIFVELDPLYRPRRDTKDYTVQSPQVAQSAIGQETVPQVAQSAIGQN